MEVLSGAASGMAVASLALQLLESIDTITTFISRVKGAPKELGRLVKSLENLSALLNHVRTVVEKQMKLQHCPVPCQTIFDSLKTCESSLTSLRHIVTNQERRLNPSASSISRFGNDIKLALKTKDIVSLEDRIQRDITTLNTALSANATSIQLATLSVLLRLEQPSSIPDLPKPSNLVQKPQPSGLQPAPIELEDVAISQCQSGLVTRTRNWPANTPLQTIGIYQRRSARVHLSTKNASNTSEHVILAEYDAFWRLLGYGIRWSRRYPVGDIFPSLRIYPVVKSFWSPGSLKWTSTIEEVQQAFSSGVLHPFTRGEHGDNLLHWAAGSRRPDIVRLLLDMGVKPEPTTNGTSPLVRFLNYTGSPFDWTETPGNQYADIETLRLLLYRCDQIDDLDTSWAPLVQLRDTDFNFTNHLHIAEWFWHHASAVYDGLELNYLRAKLAQELIGSYSPYDRTRNHAINALLINLMDVDVLELYQAGKFSLLPAKAQFYPHDCRLLIGTTFLDLISGLGLNIETCMETELQHYPGGMMWSGYMLETVGAKIVFQKGPDDGWILTWQRACSVEEPGHQVVSTFEALAIDDGNEYWDPLRRGASDWPFRDQFTPREILESAGQKHPTQIARLDRRTAAEGRKWRKVSGKKRPRDKMPGAWEW